MAENKAASHAAAGPSDGTLVAAARAGHGDAKEALFLRHAPAVNGMALRLIGRDAEVDDLVQDTFMYAFASLDQLENPGSFGAWVTSILIRRVHKTLRKRSILRKFGVLGRREPVDLDALLSASVPPDVAFELRVLYHALEAMPADLRVPLLLQRVEGMQLRDIAQAVGTSLATLKRRIVKAEEQLEAAMSMSRGGQA